MTLHEFFSVLAMTGGYLLIIVGLLVLVRALNEECDESE